MGHMALKLDMSKVYDRLEWAFLQRIMERMGFSSEVDRLDYGVCKICVLFDFSQW